MQTQALIVVPACNEVATLERVVRGILAAAGDADVLVVDDASSDGTGELADRLARAEARVRVLHRTAGRGRGSACREALAWGLERGAQVLCEMDADGSHDPGDVPRLLHTVRGADLVIGSRSVHGGGVLGGSAHRRALERGGNAFVRLCTGIPVRDATSRYRAYRRAVVEALDLSTIASDGCSFHLETTLRAWRLGFRIMELPICVVERGQGAGSSRHAVPAGVLWRSRRGISGARSIPAPHPRSVGPVT